MTKRDFRKEDLERDLTSELKAWRAERPDEWKMDEFIRVSKLKQEEIDRLREELDKHIRNEAHLIEMMGFKDIEIRRLKEVD